MFELELSQCQTIRIKTLIWGYTIETGPTEYFWGSQFSSSKQTENVIK